ncbi:cbb3-type cytochrome c oxidase N-terminal domain-containing protein [Pedobacter deserti]|uniref:cbb3-type cytochrome c oxidase N-terminal domain-containing protein n=1 Tax=Pedobacter deserti TaxID=2817382 RepID=UPI00210EF400|nr:cbb3-type cytochrome c oxidase N-terminal domain-containing protein [Pedobacter sp. SYSU D00382]
MMTDIFISILLVTALILLIVAILLLKVVRVYVQESLNPSPYISAEEREKLDLQTAAEPKPEAIKEKLSIWSKIMGLKPLSAEKDLVMEHKFDGIEELDNPTPAWFMVLFYGTICFAIVYMLSYHVFEWGPLQEEEYVIELKKAEEEKAALLLKPGNAANKINENNVEQLTDPAAIQAGAAIFKTACASCHGEHAEGLVGPNLTDEYWLHGGSIKDIFKTIKYGVPDKGMIAWEKTMRPKQIAEIASYILSLQGTNPAGAKAPQGEKM